MKYDVVLCDEPGGAGLRIGAVTGMLTACAAGKPGSMHGDGNGLHAFIASALNGAGNGRKDVGRTYNGLRIRSVR